VQLFSQADGYRVVGSKEGTNKDSYKEPYSDPQAQDGVHFRRRRGGRIGVLGRSRVAFTVRMGCMG